LISRTVKRFYSLFSGHPGWTCTRND